MNKLIHIASALLLVTACGGRNGANTSQQSYETVQEGSASGVTSTIQGPGETLPPITGTNADTTTDFALNPNALPPATTSQQPGTIDPTLGTATSYPPAGGVPPAAAPATTRPVPVRPSRPVYTPPPPTTTQTTEPPPEQTDTTQTDTAPPPATPKKNKKKDQPPPPETDTSQTDTTQTDTNPPPPPPPGQG